MNTTGTYGLGTSVRGPRGGGPGLGAIGLDQQRTATSMLGRAAEEETARNAKNEAMQRQEKAGNAQMGASAGAMAGASFGPWGMLIGGVIGGLAGGEL